MLLALDPGGTTGCASYDGADFKTRTTSTPEELYDIITTRHWDTILCERFSAQVISKYGLYTVELVGGVKALCYVKGIEIIMRTPTDRHAWQQFAENYLKDRRTRLGERFVDHQADALAHLMAHLKWEPK